jgi:pilus assembly protein CpaC
VTRCRSFALRAKSSVGHLPRSAVGLLSLCLLSLFLTTAIPDRAVANEVIPASSVASIEMGRGQLIRLSEPAASVFVADPDILDVQVRSPRLFYILGTGIGTTTLFAVNEDDDVLLSRDVTVTFGVGRLRSAIESLAPGAGVTVETLDRNLVLRGELDSAEIAEDIRRMAVQYVGDEENLINRMTVRGPSQVNLRVRVAEIARRVDERLGIQWRQLASSGPSASFLAGGQSAQASGSFTIGLAGIRGPMDLNILIDALASEGVITVLAEPNLTTQSGETASFLAGGEFPVPVAQREGALTLEYKEFGVGLTFTPTVLDSGRISLRVNPEVSELNPSDGITVGDITVPALTTRRASTTVDLASGQSFAIAGLMRETTTQEIDRLPGLGDLPILGALFRSTAFTRGETELVIIITPYIVEPTETASITTPLDDFVPPSAIERILFGRFTARPGPTSPGSEPSPRGPIGFMLE